MAKGLDILDLSNGSRFYRADLHIHSYGASHDVKDTTMTPQAIVQTASDENLHVIAIADHNEISNVQTAIAAADQTPLFVVPAVELSTPQGHPAHAMQLAQSQSRDGSKQQHYQIIQSSPCAAIIDHRFFLPRSQIARQAVAA